jgi:hypothetical protein
LFDWHGKVLDKIIFASLSKYKGNQGDQMSLLKIANLPIFGQNSYVTFSLEKGSPKVRLKNPAQRKQSPNGRKFAQSGHPANVLSPMRWLFTMSSVFKNYRRSQNFIGFFPRLSFCVNIYKKRVGQLFGRLFHKFIWSPLST